MNIKCELFKISNTEDENEIKFWNGVDVFMRVFIPIMLYSTVNIITELVFHDKWSRFVPLLTYIFLLFSISFFIMRYKNKGNQKIKLLEIEMIEIIKLALAVNGIYFFCSGIRDDAQDAFYLAATNFSLYLGFTISLEQLLKVKTWKDIVRCFLEVLPKKNFTLVMLSLCSVFGVLGICSKKTFVFVLMIIVCIFSIILLLALYAWRRREIELMCEKLVNEYSKKRILILHAGGNFAILKKIKEIIISLKDIDSLKENINQYDVVVVLDTFYGEDKKKVVLDSIKMSLKKNGLIIAPFIGKNKKRSIFRAWVGAPKHDTKFKSIEEFVKIY